MGYGRHAFQARGKDISMRIATLFVLLSVLPLSAGSIITSTADCCIVRGGTYGDGTTAFSAYVYAEGFNLGGGGGSGSINLTDRSVSYTHLTLPTILRV